MSARWSEQPSGIALGAYWPDGAMGTCVVGSGGPCNSGDDEWGKIEDVGVVYRDITSAPSPDRDTKAFPWLWVILGLLALFLILGSRRGSGRRR